MGRIRNRSFGEDAARFSLYVPLAVLIIGYLARGAADHSDRSVVYTLAGINLLLLLAGFILGLIALWSMRRYGARHILGRALIGVVLNGIALALILSVVAPVIGISTVRDRLVGQWQLQSSPATGMRLNITFNQDGTFQFTSEGDGLEQVDFSGTWQLTPSRLIGVTVDTVRVGDPSARGRKIGLGVVKSIDSRQMLLGTDAGEELYTRLPSP